MIVNLDDYGSQIKFNTFIMSNDETSEGKPFIKLICNACQSTISMNIKVKKGKYLKEEFLYISTENVDTIKDLVSIKNQTYIHCPICGTKHDIVNVEVFSRNVNSIASKGINIVDVNDIDYDF